MQEIWIKVKYTGYKDKYNRMTNYDIKNYIVSSEQIFESKYIFNLIEIIMKHYFVIILMMIANSDYFIIMMVLKK